MGCSDSYETKSHSVNSQNPKVTNLNKPLPNINFKVPIFPAFSPGDFFKDVQDSVLKSFPNGTYMGQMKDGKRDGKGNFTWDSEDSKRDTYQGEWKDDKMHGKGLYIIF